MSKKEDISYSRKILGSSLTTIISLSLVLVVIGLFGLIVIHTHSFTKQVKENIGVTIFFNDDVKEADILKMQKELDKTYYTKSTLYISKDRAASEFQKEVGEDFVNFAGFNPLKASIELHFKSEYANNDSIQKIQKEIQNNPLVFEVYYQKLMVDKINSTIKVISLFVLGFSIILFLISMALINNTIRLNIYSKRFVIRTMELVGATRGFICKPFIMKGVWHGIIASFVAVLLLTGALYFVQQQYPDIINLRYLDLYAIVFGGIFLIGIVFSWFSTWIAVHKYLRMQTDNLYF